MASLPTYLLGENGEMMEIEVIDEGVKTGEGEVEAELGQEDCGQDEECIRQKRCPSFLALKEKFRELTKATAEHSLALAGLKAAVCHPKRKLVCCPKPQALNATYLPVLGECGVSGDAAFIVGGEVGGRGGL